MNGKKIKHILLDRDLNVSKLAREIGYSRAYVSKIIHGRLRSKAVEKKICRVLGLKKEAA